MPKSSGKHIKKSKVVRLLLAHQGLELAVVDGEWRLICQCEASVPVPEGSGLFQEEAQSDWHAKHIVNVMNRKGMLK